MTILATSDLKWSDIQAILGDTGDATLEDLCNHVNVEPLGLNPAYCAGGGVTARYNTLTTAPYKMGNFRGYTSPSSALFISDYRDNNVPRCLYGEYLHPSVYWSAGFQYYTGSAYTTSVFNITTLVCNTPSVGDIAKNLGARNLTVTGPVGAGSPIWKDALIDVDICIDDEAGSALPAGSYYWGWRFGAGFYSDDYGEEDMFMPMTIYDYLISDPDEFLSFSSGGGADSFGVWTGIFTTSSVVSGGVTLTGGTNGTGNRTQNFSVPVNSSGYPIVHHIITTGAGVSSSHVYIYQEA